MTSEWKCETNRDLLKLLLEWSETNLNVDWNDADIKAEFQEYINIIKSMEKSLLVSEKFAHDVEKVFTCRNIKTEELVVNVQILNSFNKFSFF